MLEGGTMGVKWWKEGGVRRTEEERCGEADGRRRLWGGRRKERDKRENFVV